MKLSNYFLPTMKEKPSGTETISHQLMLRAGLIRSVGSGIYTWLPLGLKVLHQVMAVVREAMASAGALEVLMPAVQTSTLWEETGRWKKYGETLFKLEDRTHRHYCLGPTHEEIVTDLARKELHSYKSLPLTLFQIQTKFRDEIRPRYGIMRAREFSMKDAYSFHSDQASLLHTYEQMFQTYQHIFKTLGLEVKAVLADNGDIGGQLSHEFHVLANAGEDTLCFSTQSDYAANIERAEAIPLSSNPQTTPALKTKKIHSGSHLSFTDLIRHLNVTPKVCLKTFCVKGANTPVVRLVVRGDHELNTVKAAKHPRVAQPLQWVPHSVIQSTFGCQANYLGPLGYPEIPVIADHSVRAMCNFICGANEDYHHFKDANFTADCPIVYADLRNVVAGDPSPDGQGELQIKKGIEVAHIFQLGDSYSKKMNLTVDDPQGQAIHPVMGCYGIGLSRIVAAAIEQQHDQRGIIWPVAMAPFKVILLPIGYHRHTQVKQQAEALYTLLCAKGFSCLLDNRALPPGVMLTEAELIGIPYQIILSEKKLANNQLEIKQRATLKAIDLPIEQCATYLTQALGKPS